MTDTLYIGIDVSMVIAMAHYDEISMIRIHFAGYKPEESALPLAVACGLGDHRALPVQGNERFAKLNQWGKDQLTIVRDLKDADIVIYPHGYADGEETAKIARDARDAGKPCLFFLPSDKSSPTSVPYGTVFRSSMYSDLRQPHEQCLPPMVPDLVDEYGREHWKWRSDRPSIGFCGFVSTAARRIAYRAAGKSEKAIGLEVRVKAIKVLQKCKGVDCKFIHRRDFWAGLGGNHTVTEDERTTVRREFIENLFNTDYNLCLRGAGNYSMRFYETLSAGRIPLYVNTRCVLPFEDEIDWTKHVVRIEESNLQNLGDIIVNFHRGLSDEAFLALQRANRQLWLDYFAPHSYFKRILERALNDARSNQSG